MREEEGDCLLGCGVGCCCCCVCFFLFHKATLGFDAVVVIRGLAAATGFGLGALLDMRLRHTPPGGEVEGHTPRPRENPIPLHAVPLQLVTEHRHLVCTFSLTKRLDLIWHFVSGLTCSVLFWNSLSSSSVRGRKLSSFSGYSCQPMAFSNLHKDSHFLLS